MRTPHHGVLAEYLTLTQAAAYLRCSTETLRRRINEGLLPTYPLNQRTRLVKVSDLDVLAIRKGMK